MTSFTDKSVTLTCVCGCSSIRFDYYEEDSECCITPYAIMAEPVIISNSIWNRIWLAWGMLFKRYPEPTMIISQEEWPLLCEFIHKVEAHKKVEK